MNKEFAIGQTWQYRALKDFEDSRIVIGAIEHLQSDNLENKTLVSNQVICVSILHAPVPRQNKAFVRATIPFLAFSYEALEATVTNLAPSSDPLDPEIQRDFTAAYAAWKNNPEGIQVIEVPFSILLAELCKDM